MGRMRLNEAQRSLVSNVRWGGGGKPEVPSGRVNLEPRWTSAVHLCFPDLFNTYRATSACHTLLQRFQHRTRQTDQAWTLELILQRKGFASLWESEQGRESEGERARTPQLLSWLSGNSVVNHGKKQPGLIKPAATLWVPISRRPHRRPLVPAFLLRPCWVRLPISICERISSKNKATRWCHKSTRT